MIDIEKIITDRTAAYGGVDRVSAMYSKLVQAMQLNKLDTTEEYIFFNIASKLARMACAPTITVDTLVDLAGYFTLWARHKEAKGD